MFYTGKTKEEAIQKGLEDLNITIEEAEITFIKEETKKGFLGFGAKTEITISVEKKEGVEIKKSQPKKEKEVKKELKKEEKANEKVVKETKKEEKKVAKKEVKQNNLENEQKAENFLKEILLKLDVQAEIEKEYGDKESVIYTIKTQNSKKVIGLKGETIDSLQTLISAIVNTNKKDHVRVVVDCEGYRERREESLVKLAKKVADSAIEKGRKLALEPMSAYERRVVHAALIDNENVKTESLGKDPERYVVVIPNELKDNKIEFVGRNKKNKKKEKFKNKKGYKNKPQNKEVKTLEKKEINFGTFLGNSNETK